MRIEHSQLAMFLLWVYGEVVSDKRFKADRVVRLKGCTRVLLVALAPPPPATHMFRYSSGFISRIELIMLK